MALSITQQAALLFKKLFGKAQTTTARDFFEEPFNAPPTVLTSQIWTDSAQVPLTASVSFTGSGHIIGVVQYLEDISLTLVAGTSNSFQDNQLRDAIPFNYGNGSYNYAIKDSTSTAIPFGTNDWIVDTEGGVLTFYNSVPANMPPTITFYKYVGNKGLASASVNLANSASYALTASYASNAGTVNFNTGSYTGSFTGSLLGSSSYALSSSWAARSVSASYAGTDWNAINNKPTVVSSSVQINTGSFTGSFTGSLLGSASYALSSSWAARSVSASYAGTDWNAINNKPTVFSSSLQTSTGSFTGSFTGSLLGSSSYALSSSWSSISVSSSYALSASWAPGSAGGDFNTLVNKPTLVSSSAQVNTGSFTGSFTGGLAGTASYALNAATASYISSSVDFPNGLTVTGSITASTGFYGNGANITGVISSSYALTASYAMNGGGSGVSSSYALTASYASYAPTALSASFATSALTASYMTGSINFTDGLTVTGSVTASVGYTGSFTGSLLGSASYALTSSAATSITFVPLTASYALSAGATGGGLTGDGAAGFVTLFNGTTSVTASVIQADNSRVTMNVPLTASFFQGTGSAIVGVISASYATTAATASYISGGLDLSSGLIVTGSVTASIGYTGSFTGSLLGSSSYALSSSYAMSASWAPGGGGDFNTLINKPTLVSSSAQVNTGSFTGSFTGNLLGSSSYATTAATASYITGTISFPNGLVVTGSVTASAYTGSYTGSLLGSASYALSASWAPGGGAADFNTLLNKPTLVSSSAQVNTGSFTGSFTGNFLGSASYALTASAATSITFIPISASYAISSSAATSITFLPASASYANATTWNSVNNKPTVVSASAQVNTGSFTGSFTGGLLGSASYAPTSWIDISNKPVGLVSSSIQINTGSFTGSFTGSLLGSSSYALSSSYAMSASWAPGGGTADYTQLTNVPVGILSGSAQINLLTNVSASWASRSISSSYAVTSSYATVAQNVLGAITSASYAQFATSASYFTGSLTFPAGLIVTGSVTASVGYTGSFTGSLLGTASYAGTDWSAVNNKPVGIVSSSAQVVSNVLGQSISPSIVSSSTIYITGSLAVSGTSAFTGSVNFYNGIGPVTIAGALYTTASLTINSGTTLIASVPTGSYDMTTFNYVIKSGSHARAGSVIGVWSASVVEYTDVSTNDIGNTGQFSFVMDVSQSNVRLRGTTPTDTWLVKTIIHAI